MSGRHRVRDATLGLVELRREEGRRRQRDHDADGQPQHLRHRFVDAGLVVLVVPRRGARVRSSPYVVCIQIAKGSSARWLSCSVIRHSVVMVNVHRYRGALSAHPPNASLMRCASG